MRNYSDYKKVQYRTNDGELMDNNNIITVDVDNWFSNDPKINDYLKTHDSISVRKTLMDNGERRQGVFTFYKNRDDCMWTLTIEDYEPLAIEFGRKEND